MFAEEAGELAFHALPFLTNDDVADVLQIARTRIIALLRRKGVISDDDESGASVVTADATLADTEPALAELAVASTLGAVPAGPALHRRDPIKLRADSELMHTKALCAAEHGFTLHAATTASAGDTAGREALCKYILRPPIAQDRIQLVADDLVRLTLKKPFSDGTFAIDQTLCPFWRGSRRPCILRVSIPSGTVEFLRPPANGDRASFRRHHRSTRRRTTTARHAPRRKTSRPRIAADIGRGKPCSGAVSKSTSSSVNAAAA
ncbi:MAG: transposase [Myxococcales bacterium]|nr:transposase [Myxococcales bacterium]